MIKIWAFMWHQNKHHFWLSPRDDNALGTSYLDTEIVLCLWPWHECVHRYKHSLCAFLLHVLSVRGNSTQNRNWAYLCTISKFSTLFKSNTIILKQIVRETHNWHLSFSKSSSSWVFNQNVQMHDSKPLDLLKFYCHFWISEIICFRIHILVSFLKKMIILRLLKTCSILVWDAVSP